MQTLRIYQDDARYEKSEGRIKHQGHTFEALVTPG
jgi:hypothetical protein